MSDSPNQAEAREAIDRSAEAFQVWESEILLRSAAWVAIFQGLFGVVALSLRYLPGNEIMGVAVVSPIVLCALLLSLVQSCACRSVLILGCLTISVLAARGEPDYPRVMWWDKASPAPLVACLLYSAMGLLLMRRSRFGRDVLVALAGSWLVYLLPGLVAIMIRPALARFLGIETTLQISALLIPAFFVCAVLASRAGRSLFVSPAIQRPLAPLTSLRYAGGGARAWAAAIMIPLTCVGCVVFLREFGRALRGLW